MEKYGWDNLIKEVVLIADDDYCLNIEKQLRPSDKIGWNIVMGGGKPPSALGKKFVRSEEYRRKQSLSHKGKSAWNVGITLTEEQKAKQKAKAQEKIVIGTCSRDELTKRKKSKNH
jgi:hypothetical protein